MRRLSVVLIIGAAVVFVAVGLLLISGECGGDASCPATARVADRTYAVGPLQGAVVTEADLTPFDRVQTKASGYFLDDQVFALQDVDPSTFLVARTALTMRADPNQWGEFLGLWGQGQDPDLCRYFTELPPTWCE